MAFRLAILGSGSAGNCALLETDEARVLVDVGLSGKKIEQRLALLGLGWDRIDAILLTHEHGDHTLGLSALKKQSHIPVYASEGTAEALRRDCPENIRWHAFAAEGAFRLRDLEVESFAVPHDARDPVGFIFSHGQDDLFSPRRRLAWLTDLGYVPEGVRRRIHDVNTISLEANYCPELLKNDTRRPWSLRQRISGRHGHLSNAATRALLEEVNGPGWRHIILTHLSQDCNHPTAVETALAGVPCLQRCRVTLAPPEGANLWHEV